MRGQQAKISEYDDLFAPARGEGADGDVEAFYDRYPYPPPVDNLDSYRRRWQARARRQPNFHLLWPSRPYSEEFSILVAGCGTSQAAKYALRWPRARVVGFDFSSNALRNTEQLKRKHRLDNLEVRKLALERVGDLETTFDHVVCTGVLHHLRDPVLGLRRLRDVLKPHGAMHLMVYATHGRRGIYMVQEFFRSIGVGASDVDMDVVLATLKALPKEHPVCALVRDTSDLCDGAAIADALLNPRDRAYSVPEFFELVDASRLRFGRWLRQAPYRIQVGLMSRLPETLGVERAPVERQYAAAELLRGTMARHSALLYRDDGPQDSSIAFAGNSWLNYVPIRLPDTILIRERLPPGMAAILINQTHPFRDICLPLRPSEEPVFEAIDGQHSIGALLPQSFTREKARILFERLWWHDQVVFDATRSRNIASFAEAQARLPLTGD